MAPPPAFAAPASAPGPRPSRGLRAARAPGARLSRVRRTPRMQTWSDPAATREYLDFLSGAGARLATRDCASTIVGAGALGNFLLAHGGGDDVLVARGDAIPADAPGPVYVCVRADDVERVLAACPDAKRGDLVLLQAGMLDAVLRRHGALDCTRASLTFAVRGGGVAMDSAPASAVAGSWEGALQERLARAGVHCDVASARDFRRASLERLVFLAAFHLLGAVHGGIPLGEVARAHSAEADSLAREMATMLRFSLAVGMMPGLEGRLLEMAGKMGAEPTRFEDFRWRNGFFYEHSQTAMRNDFPDPTPMHTNYLEEGREMGLISWP